MFIIDDHLDLSMNALEWNRELTKSPTEIYLRKRGLKDKPHGVMQLNALHFGIGTDLEGVFGRDKCPYDLETWQLITHIPFTKNKHVCSAF